VIEKCGKPAQRSSCPNKGRARQARLLFGAVDRVDLRSVAALFLRLSVTAFGGPAAHTAMMHRECVRRRSWIDEQSFIDHMALTNLVPGPNSTELSMLIGRHVAGRPGLLVAGACFIVPASLIVLVFSWLYVEYGQTPSAEALLYGISPVVIAIVGQAIVSLARAALKGVLLWILGTAAFALALAGVHELVVLFGAGLVMVAIRTGRSAVGVFVPLGIEFARAAAAEVQLDRLFLLFLKIGAVLYGSGYVLLAFIRADFVDRLGWLTQQQLIDAVAIGQFTPGPLFTTATFVGFVLAGLPGALLSTAGIFLPSFVFSAIVFPFSERMRTIEWTAALMDGFHAGAIGLMAAVAWQLGRAAIIDVPTALLALAALGVLLRFDINSAWLVIAGGLAGLLLH
jgi:chromate transporter